MHLKLGKYTIYYRNLSEMFLLYLHIFILRNYSISFKTRTPYIIDCGAHIGLATLFFKKQYPQSEIVAIEANPLNFSALHENISHNTLTQIHPVQGALTKSTQPSVPFYIAADPHAWSWGDSLDKDVTRRSSRGGIKQVLVPSIQLSTFLTKQVDLLKLDIESAETEVIYSIKDQLHFIQNIIFEFHITPKNTENDLKNLISMLEQQNFIVSKSFYRSITGGNLWSIPTYIAQKR